MITSIVKIRQGRLGEVKYFAEGQISEKKIQRQGCLTSKPCSFQDRAVAAGRDVITASVTNERLWDPRTERLSTEPPKNGSLPCDYEVSSTEWEENASVS